MTQPLKGPMTGQHAFDFWSDNYVRGCACAFCSGTWTKKSDPAWDVLPTDERRANTLLQGYGTVTGGPHAGAMVHGCVNKVGFYTEAAVGPLGGWLPHEYTPVLPVPPEPELSKDAPPGGCICMRCGMKNPEAAPNRKDGKYVCYECR